MFRAASDKASTQEYGVTTRLVAEIKAGNSFLSNSSIVRRFDDNHPDRMWSEVASNGITGAIFAASYVVLIGILVGNPIILFRGLSRQVFSADEKYNFLNTLHRLVKLSEAKKIEIINDLTLQYKKTKTILSSQESDALLSTLQDDTLSIGEKIDAILYYMLTVNVEGILVNQGKKFFVLVARHDLIKIPLHESIVEAAPSAPPADASSSVTETSDMADALVSAAFYAENSASQITQQNRNLIEMDIIPNTSYPAISASSGESTYKVYRQIMLEKQRQEQQIGTVAAVVESKNPSLPELTSTLGDGYATLAEKVYPSVSVQRYQLPNVPTSKPALPSSISTTSNEHANDTRIAVKM